jgi:hypothetical protein
VELEILKDQVRQLFESTGRDVDEFVELMGSAGINEINIEAYMNVFEIMVDDLVAENEGLDCSLAIEHDKMIIEENDVEIGVNKLSPNMLGSLERAKENSDSSFDSQIVSSNDRISED